MWVLETPPAANAAVVIVLGILTFIPIKFVHPIRVRDHRPVTYAALIAWALCSAGLVLLGNGQALLFWPWVAASCWLAYVSLRRTLAGPSEPPR